MTHLIIFHAFVGLSLRQYGDDVGSDYSIDDALQTARDAGLYKIAAKLIFEACFKYEPKYYLRNEDYKTLELEKPLWQAIIEDTCSGRLKENISTGCPKNTLYVIPNMLSLFRIEQIDS